MQYFYMISITAKELTPWKRDLFCERSSRSAG